MNSKPLDRLLVCYVPAMDLRRIGSGVCPYFSSLFALHPWVRIRTLPTVEHVPTMLTGANPHEHGQWGPRLKAARTPRSMMHQLIDHLPDLVTTTVQGIMHLTNGPMDLATMAPRRRRRFEWLRFKFIKHDDVHKVVLPIGGMESIFTVVGSERGRYVYQDNYRRLDRLLDEIANAEYLFEMVEVHCLDRLQHWNLHHEEQIAGYYRGVDSFVAALHAKCRKSVTGFIVLSDHGMEPVISTIDIFNELKSSSVPTDEYDFFIENTKATFWFHSETARSKIMSLLTCFEHGTVVTREEMTKYDLHFSDNAHGDVYFYAEPGYSFFPNDFYQPLANTILALMDWQQRPRFWDPRHKGDHGYFPDSECENGFMLLAEEGYEAPEESISLIDVAPSVLALLGRRRSDTMKGRSVFRRQPSGKRYP